MLSSNSRVSVSVPLATPARAVPFTLSLVAVFAFFAACERSSSGSTDPNKAAGHIARVQVAATVEDGADSVELGGMVHWLEPSPPPPAARSEEERQRGMEFGRPTPEPELLQPSLDPRLPKFEPWGDSRIAGRFVGGASDILPGLVACWLDAFRVYYPDVEIEIDAPYAGSLGILKVIDGEYDFVFVSRELKPTDITAFNEKYGYDPFTVAVSGGSYRHYGFLDAIGFFVNTRNPLERLSFDQIDALFSATRNRGTAKISTWGELGLGGEWAELPVHLYGIEPWNGFEEFVRQRVLNSEGRRGEWRDDIHFTPHAFHVAELVANDPLGIGYTGLAYLNWPVKVLPLAAGSDGSHFVAPSYEHVADATYPLSRLIYFNANRAPDEDLPPALGELLRFILSAEGQRIVLEHTIYMPLRQHQVHPGLEALDSHLPGARKTDAS